MSSAESIYSLDTQMGQLQNFQHHQQDGKVCYTSMGNINVTEWRVGYIP